MNKACVDCEAALVCLAHGVTLVYYQHTITIGSIRVWRLYTRGGSPEYTPQLSVDFKGNILFKNCPLWGGQYAFWYVGKEEVKMNQECVDCEAALVCLAQGIRFVEYVWTHENDIVRWHLYARYSHNKLVNEVEFEGYIPDMCPFRETMRLRAWRDRGSEDEQSMC